MTIPTFLPYFVFAGTAVTLVAILYGLHRSLVEAGWPEADRARTFRASSALLLGWLAVTIVLGALGVYHVSSNEIPTIQYGILLPILAGALLIWRSETAKRVVAAVPQSWLVGVQLYRALGVIFLILYATGKLPSAVRLARRHRRHRHRSPGAYRGRCLCAGAAQRSDPRGGLERIRYSRSRHRGRDRLRHRAVVHSAHRGPADERADDRPANGADPGLPRAAIDCAASRFAGEVSPRGGRRQRFRPARGRVVLGTEAKAVSSAARANSIRLQAGPAAAASRSYRRRRPKPAAR